MWGVQVGWTGMMIDVTNEESCSECGSFLCSLCITTLIISELVVVSAVMRWIIAQYWVQVFE